MHRWLTNSRQPAANFLCAFQLLSRSVASSILVRRSHVLRGRILSFILSTCLWVGDLNRISRAVSKKHVSTSIICWFFSDDNVRATSFLTLVQPKLRKASEAQFQG